jgi:hypothetical protein
MPAARPHSEQNLAEVGSTAPQCPQDLASGAPHSSQNLACGRFSRWHRGQCIPSVSRFRIASAGQDQASRHPGGRRSSASPTVPRGYGSPDPTASRPPAPAWLPLAVSPLADPFPSASVAQQRGRRSVAPVASWSQRNHLPGRQPDTRRPRRSVERGPSPTGRRARSVGGGAQTPALADGLAPPSPRAVGADREAAGAATCGPCQSLGPSSRPVR